jgi:hypothetical protein
MKKWLAIGVIVGIVALVGALGWSAVAFAQGPMNGPMWGQGGPGGGPRFGPGGFGGPPAFGRDELGMGPGFGPGGFGERIDHQALLAEALGITVEELQAAQEQAHAAAIQQAVDEGLITQEEADQMTARMQLRSYLDPEALMAKALGITEQELQAARDEGKPIAVLIYELGLDPATVRTQMQTAREEAIQQAVTDGVITQEQADQILAGPAFGGPGGFGGPHRGGGFGGPGGFWWR